MLRDDRILVHEPTRHPQNEELVIGNIRFSAFDLGGHAAARRLWRNYFAAVDAIVFLVDATDYRRFGEAREELSRLLTSDELSKGETQRAQQQQQQQQHRVYLCCVRGRYCFCCCCN